MEFNGDADVEFASVECGAAYEMMSGGDSYLAMFGIAGPRPRPADIKPCKG